MKKFNKTMKMDEIKFEICENHIINIFYRETYCLNFLNMLQFENHGNIHQS